MTYLDSVDDMDYGDRAAFICHCIRSFPLAGWVPHESGEPVLTLTVPGRWRADVHFLRRGVALPEHLAPVLPLATLIGANRDLAAHYIMTLTLEEDRDDIIMEVEFEDDCIDIRLMIGGDWEERFFGLAWSPHAGM